MERMITRCFVSVCLITGTLVVSSDLIAQTFKVIRAEPLAGFAGRIKNHTEDPLYDIKIKVSFLDTSGAVLGERQTYPSDGSSRFDPLSPCEESSFDGMIKLENSDIDSTSIKNEDYSTVVTITMNGARVDDDSTLSLVSFIGLIIPPYVAEVRNRNLTVTMTDYDILKIGMSYDTASDIFGFSGEEQGRSSISGNTTVMYMWSNGDGSGVSGTFYNDKLTSKSQFGLK